MEGRMLRAIRVVITLIGTAFNSIGLAFNTYAVPLKKAFHLEQTEVELMGSFAVAGLSVMLLGSFIYNRYGRRLCYLLIWCLVSIWGAAMWLASRNVNFFRHHLELLYLFQLIGTSGMVVGLLLFPAFGIQQFPESKRGLAVGLYAAVIGVGKIYYTVLFDCVFSEESPLLQFFPTVVLSITAIITLSFLTDRENTSSPAENNGSDPDWTITQSNNIEKSMHMAGSLQTRPEQIPETIPLKQPVTRTNVEKSETYGQPLLGWKGLLRSGRFVRMIFCFALFQAATYTFRNNVTGFGESINEVQSLNLLYLLVTVVIVTRISVGWIYDKSKSSLTGEIMLAAGYICFAAAMFIGLFWLDDVTIYVMMFLGGIACALGYVVPMVMLTSEFGMDHYTHIAGSSCFLLGPFSLLTHYMCGMAYEIEAKKLHTHVLFCEPCFYWTFLILLIVTAVVCAVKLLDCCLYDNIAFKDKLKTVDSETP